MRRKTAAWRLWMLLSLCLLACLSPARPAVGESEVRIYTLSWPIRAASDDMEEWLSSGKLNYGSTDLELGVEHPGGTPDGAQLVGLRFAQLTIPSGAVVLDAYIQFAGKEVKSPDAPFDVVIAVEDAADSAPFNQGSASALLAPYDLSSRKTAGPSVRWTLTAQEAALWMAADETGAARRTPDLSALVQAIVDRPDWASGNAMAFILSGTGNRTAYAYERDPSRAPVLRATFAYAGDLAAQAAPAGLTAVPPTRQANDNGKIAGTTADMEYRLSDGDESAWQPCSAPAVAGLAAGTYCVRYAAREDCEAGPATTIVLPECPPADYLATHITLQPGADASEMNFAWYVKGVASRCVVQVAQRAAMIGEDFPEHAALSVEGTMRDDYGFTANKASVRGLVPNTAYVYRLGDGASFGDVHGFSTRSPESYGFLVMGDPQIGGSGYVARDTREWKNTLAKALQAFPDTSFMLSMGDQVETSADRAQYAGFFAPAQLSSVPLVPVVGNHDNGALFAKHFNPPNESEVYGASSACGDYWFTYGNTLFMVLNTNKKGASAHDAFMREAIDAAGPGIVWKIVAAHHSIYSSAPHSSEAEIMLLREALVPLFDKHGVDLVLMGHDHCYTRTHQMLGGVAQNGEADYAIDPEGTLYVTVNSSSGSKYYKFRSLDEGYRAVRWQGGEPSYTSAWVTDNALTLKTYTTYGGELIDAYTIFKTASPLSRPEGVPVMVADADAGSSGNADPE